MLRSQYPLWLILEVSGIKRSSYYKWRKLKNITTQKKEQDLIILEKIKILYEKHKGRYGVLRMTHALKSDYGIVANHKRVHRIMRENGYLAVIKAKNKQKYKKSENTCENILNRNFSGSCPYDKMATDITEIKKSGKTIYLSPIKDLYTNMIESWEVSYSPTLKTATSPLMQIKDKTLPEGTFLHSDQGGLYTSPVFQDILRENNFIQSMSRKGTPIDNSPMESFFGTMKSELLYNPLIKIHNDEELITMINDYINYYNNSRIQKKLGYLTPAEFKAKSLNIES
jgi:putative transposase